MTGFTPPTPEQLAHHLEQHPPRRPSATQAYAPLAAVVGAMIFGLALGGTVGAAMPWLAAMGVFAYLTIRVRLQRNAETEANLAQESAALRRFPEALRQAWKLLPNVVTVPLLHARAVALIAHCLNHLKAYDAAIVGYDYLLHHLPDGDPNVPQLRVQRAIAALGSDRLTDADDSLRRLRNQLPPDERSPTRAGFRLAQLIQQVRTNHFEDARQESGDLIDDLRPLGVEAGYGYGLMAYCWHQIGDHARASTWWRRATLLLPVHTLIERFPELTAFAPGNAAGEGPFAAVGETTGGLA